MGIILQDINRLAETNIGGVLSIELCDSRLCPSFNTINNEVSQNLKVTESDWSKIEPVNDSIDFSSKAKYVKGILLLDQKLSLVVPKHRAVVDQLIIQLNKARWVLLVHGNNGSIVLGSKTAPLKFKLKDIQYKGKRTQKNGYRFSFELLSQEKPSFYTYVSIVNNSLPATAAYWENGSLAHWEDGSIKEFENV